MSRRDKSKLAPFVALFRHTIKSPAWKALSVGARATFLAAEPTKHVMTDTDKQRLKQRRQRPDPVPPVGTPHPYGLDKQQVAPITESTPNGPSGRDKENDTDRPSGRDITSFTGSQPKPRLPWTTPTLTEIEYTPALRRLYQSEVIDFMASLTMSNGTSSHSLAVH